MPTLFPDHEVCYEVAAGCRRLVKVGASRMLKEALSENFGTTAAVHAMADFLRGTLRKQPERLEEYRVLCREAILKVPLSPKLECLLGVLDDLFNGRVNDTAHRKVVVSFLHRSTGWLLEELLALRVPGVAVFRLFGAGTAESCRLEQSQLFLAEEARLAVLLLAVKVGGEGINLVNANLSPSALVRYELSDSSMTDRQVIGRIARRGNVYPVQPVRLVGDGTLNGWRWKLITGHRENEKKSGVLKKTRMAASRGMRSIQRALRRKHAAAAA
jgi:hypothetical protein